MKRQLESPAKPHEPHVRFDTKGWCRDEIGWHRSGRLWDPIECRWFRWVAYSDGRPSPRYKRPVIYDGFPTVEPSRVAQNYLDALIFSNN